MSDSPNDFRNIVAFMGTDAIEAALGRAADALEQAQEEIERLTAEYSDLEKLAQAAFDGWARGKDVAGPMHKLYAHLAATVSGKQETKL